MITAEGIWDVLETHCGAAHMKEDFVRHAGEALESGQKLEYRFQGALGFGGKVKINYGPEITVYCYPEDGTPERRVMVGDANSALAALRKE